MRAFLLSTPTSAVTLDTLRSLGILYWCLPDAFEAQLDAIKRARGYTYSDVCDSRKIPNLARRLEAFKHEHLHDDEEVRFVVDGSGYFDVRDVDDEWIRVHCAKGDLVVLPRGCLHRFVPDDALFFVAMRFFAGEPRWTPYHAHDAATLERPARKEYVERWLEPARRARRQLQSSAANHNTDADASRSSSNSSNSSSSSADATATVPRRSKRTAATPASTTTNDGVSDKRARLTTATTTASTSTPTSTTPTTPTTPTATPTTPPTKASATAAASSAAVSVPPPACAPRDSFVVDGGTVSNVRLHAARCTMPTTSPSPSPSALRLLMRMLGVAFTDVVVPRAQQRSSLVDNDAPLSTLHYTLRSAAGDDTHDVVVAHTASSMVFLCSLAPERAQQLALWPVDDVGAQARVLELVLAFDRLVVQSAATSHSALAERDAERQRAMHADFVERRLHPFLLWFSSLLSRSQRHSSPPPQPQQQQQQQQQQQHDRQPSPKRPSSIAGFALGRAATLADVLAFAHLHSLFADSGDVHWPSRAALVERYPSLDAYVEHVRRFLLASGAELSSM